MIDFVKRWLRWRWRRPQVGSYWRSVGSVWYFDRQAFREALWRWRRSKPVRRCVAASEHFGVVGQARPSGGCAADSVGNGGRSSG